MDCVGKSYPAFDALEKVTGSAVYTDDIRLPNMLHGRILFSPVAHARIVSIDTSAAEALEGVEAVVSYKNSPQLKFNSTMESLDEQLPETEMIFDSLVRFVGDKVAAVAAVSPEIAKKAIGLIKVEYEELPSIFDMKEALKKDATKIHSGGNLITKVVQELKSDEDLIKDEDIRISSTIKTPKIHHATIEPFQCVANWGRDNNVSVWTPNQGLFGCQLLLGKIFDLPLNKVHVIKPKMGGAFGGKRGAILEPVALLLSKMTRKPVKIRLDRKDTMVSTSTKYASEYSVSSIVGKDGKIKSLDFEVYLDAGAYCSNTISILYGMCSKAFMLYNVPNIRFTGYGVYTNTPNGGAMRGFGATQYCAAIETHMFKIARTLNMDLEKIYLNNLFKPYDLHPLDKSSLGNCRIIDCVKEGVKVFNETKDENSLSSDTDNRYRIGYGFAAAAHGNGSVPFFPDLTGASIQILEDGSMVLALGVADSGCGTYTIMRQMTSEILDIRPELITIVETDTKYTPYDIGAVASRNTWVGGNAVVELCNEVKEELIGYAGEYLETDSSDIHMKDGKFTCSSKDRTVTREELVRFIFKNKNRKIIKASNYSSKANVGSYGAHFAKVKVDTLTGEVAVTDYLAVCDIGKAINPMLVEGQLHGGIQMGMGFALTEELQIDKTTGRVTNSSFKKYKMPKAQDMPRIEIKLIEKEENGGPFGAKGIGEIATVPVAPAIINAVNDALGTELSDLPLTPDKILKALGNEHS